MAEPSDKNSGFDKTSNVLFFKPASKDDFKIDLIVSAVLTGRVLFSTTIVCPWA